MTYPDCTTFAGYDIDVYLLLLSFVVILVSSFSCSCIDNGGRQAVVPNDGKRKQAKQEKSDEPEPNQTALRLFCGNEFCCCKEVKQPERAPGAIALSIVIRIVIAFVGGLLATWLILTIIFVAAQQSIMYPAELATDCTPCTGNISTITFVDYESAAADRSPYCCDYTPTGYLNVSFWPIAFTGICVLWFVPCPSHDLSRALSIQVAREGFVATAEGDSVNWWFIPGDAAFGAFEYRFRGTVRSIC